MGMIAFHGDKKIKSRYIARVEAHRKADELVQGIGWESNGVTRGCGIGCTFDAYDHSRGPIEIGVPVHLMYLEDAIFEGLPEADALKWPTRFLKAIQPGADLSLVWPRFAVWMLTDAKCGVIRFAGNYADVRQSIERVSALWRRVIDGESVESLSGEFAAAAAAAAAARWSADAARWSAVAARTVHWRACAEKCIDLIADCQPVKSLGKETE